MLNLQNSVLACLLVGTLSGGLSGVYFYRNGRSDERLVWLDAEQKRTDTAAEVSRIAAAAETRRAAASEQRSVEAVARVREVKREVAYVDRPGCEWADDERLRLQSVHRAYFDTSASAGLPDGLHRTAVPVGPPSGLGGADARLVLRVPEAADGLRGVGEK